MNILIIISVVIISTELLLRSKFFLSINAIISLIKKSIKIISSAKISDQWKEKIIPNYSIRIIRSSLSMLIALVIIFFIFLLSGFFFKDFQDFILSWEGIFLSILISSGYLRLKSIIKK